MMNSVIFNTIKQNWHFIIIVILIIIIFGVIEIFLPRMRKKIDKKISGFINKKK